MSTYLVLCQDGVQVPVVLVHGVAPTRTTRVGRALLAREPPLLHDLHPTRRRGEARRVHAGYLVQQSWEEGAGAAHMRQ